MTMAWRPFLEPMPVDDLWLVLIVPLVLAIAVVYKVIRLRDLRGLPIQTVVLAAQIVVFMILAALILWVITEV